MFTNIKVHPDVRAQYAPLETQKKVKLQPQPANALEDNVLVVAYNTAGNGSMTSANNPKKIELPSGGGTANIGVVLKPEATTPIVFPDQTWLIGVGDSNDTTEPQSAAAELQILYLNTAPRDATAPRIQSGAVHFSGTPIGAQAAYLIDLKANAGSLRYCQVKVKPISGTSNSFLEGKVYIHLLTAENASPYVIFAQEHPGVSSDQGEPTTSIQNGNIYFDLSSLTNLYLVAMVGASGSNPYNFEVGDPKLDAGVGASEV